MTRRSRIPVTIPTDPVVLAYIAGIIDGEGSVSVSSMFDKKKSKSLSYAIRVTVTNTYPALMAWLMEHVGAPALQRSGEFSRKDNPGWKVAWDWTLHGTNAIMLLQALLPYLVLKREQALTVLQFGSFRKASSWHPETETERLQKKALKDKIHVLNARGVA